MPTKFRKLVTDRLSDSRKGKLLQQRARARFALHKLLGKDSGNELVASTIAPIFVIGTNRSGASVCTLMLSKHPEIEGIFQGVETSHQIGASGHAANRVEANHIWRSLARPDFDITQGESILWGLPESISRVYIGSVSEGEKRQLIDELLAARATTKIPLVMNSHNVFRIPLIKGLFPEARFVLMTRDHESFIKSGKHKWTTDREVGVLGPDSYIDYPHIGLHWLLINAIALYDLKKYAPADYIHIKLQDLHGTAVERTEIINRVFGFLGLDSIEMLDDVFDDGFIFTRSEGSGEIDVLSLLVNNLFDYENGLDQPD